MGQPGLGLGRDPCRTPMQWDDSAGAGFTTGAPWLPVADDFSTVNVAAQRGDPRLVLSLHRELLALRRGNPALLGGSYARHASPDGVFAFTRGDGDRRVLVALNFGPTEMKVGLPDAGGRVLLSTHLDRAGDEAGPLLTLRGDEGVIVALASV